MTKLTDEDFDNIINSILSDIDKNGFDDIQIADMHNMVEHALDIVNPSIAKSYRDYRNYKIDFVHMMDKVYEKSQSIRYIGDKENGNTDSALVATKRSLIFNELNKRLYRRFFMTVDERQACRDGYIYVHDQSARLDTINCCLFDAKRVMDNGFEMGNVWYNVPKTLDVAFDVLGDIILSTASQQYGGFTVPEVDKLLAPYAEKSFQIYFDEFIKIKLDIGEDEDIPEKIDFDIYTKAAEWANKKVKREYEQGFQGIEMKLNTVGSSRGDYPFITMTFGLATDTFGKMATMTALEVHKNGQGKKGNKKPVLFPKLVFLYDENLHGAGKQLEDVFETGIECSSKTMYPDWLSLTGNGYVPSMYKKYGAVVSPMGCRAFLSPWFERGGMEPADEDDKPVFVGRFNIGAVSLHLPLILAKARQENRDFYEVLDYYLEMIRGIHKRTYEYLGELKASINPVLFCEGGCYGGNLKPSDKIKPLLKPMTASFGITALNELQHLYNGKSITEDGQFALDVLKYINMKIIQFKKEDENLYAIYGTPAENLCFAAGTQVQTYVDGRCMVKNIEDIVKGDLVYSYNEEKHKIELKPVLESMMTRERAKVLKITFTNGQSVTCTPDHPFAKRTMIVDKDTKRFIYETIQYTEARFLKPGNRLKSNYVTIDGGGHLKCTTDQWIHNINAEYAYGIKPDGYVTHHSDEDKLNNSFKNLQYMSDADHKRFNIASSIKKFQFTHESTKGINNPFYGKRHTNKSKELNRVKHLGKNNVGSKEVIQLNMDGSIVAVHESRSLAEESTGFKNISYACNGLYKNKSEPHEYKGYLWFYTDQLQECSGFVNNHIVESVQYINEEIPVYDIEVADNHNFYVGGMSGILVHNCGLQVTQFRRLYGIVEGVSDRPYVSNSFHCHVTENIDPIEKQDLEGRFWDLCNGGKIQYVKYPIDYNIEAIRTLVRRAMELGYYEGINLSLAYCEECGHQELEMDVCPKCGSRNLTKIDRMNGYLAYSRVHGDTRLNSAKMSEIAERVSM